MSPVSMDLAIADIFAANGIAAMDLLTLVTGAHMKMFL